MWSPITPPHEATPDLIGLIKQGVFLLASGSNPTETSTPTKLLAVGTV